MGSEGRQVREGTSAPTWSRSATALHKMWVLGFSDQLLTGPGLLHHIQRLDHIAEVRGAEKRQTDLL